MPSPADAGRVRFERALRAGALGLVLFALWRLVQPQAPGSAVYVDGATIDRALPRIIASGAPAVYATFAATPQPGQRDALCALRHAGVDVTWRATGRPFVPLAVNADRVQDPSASVRVVTVSSGTVELADALSVIDTVQAARGSTVLTGAPVGAVLANAENANGSAAVAPPSTPRPILVLGRVTWDAKFTIAALEEAGWTVATRLVVAPGAEVTQGTAMTIDTAHYSAIVALDSALGTAGTQLAGFVRSGGGLVLVGEAGAASATRGLAPAGVGARRVAATMTFDVQQPLRSLPLYPLVVTTPDAVQLDLRGDLIAVSARREGAGRVVQVGYDELWRWRMQGGDDGVAGHRAWWSRLVGGVVPIPSPPRGALVADEGAPVARLFDALGAPAAAAPRRAPAERLPVWLLPLICALLLGEWGLRRFRGAQ